MPCSRLLLLVTVCALPLAGSEFAMRDLRIGLAALPSSYDYTITGSAASVSGSDGFDSGTGLEAGVRWSWSRPGGSFGLVGGLDAVLDGFTAGSGGGMVGYGGRASLGAGWAVADRWQVVGEAGLTYGRASLDLDATRNTVALTASGSYLAYDARLVATFQAWQSVQVQALAGWQVASYSLSGSAVDITLDRAGLMVGLGLAWRLDASPTRLE